MKALLMTSLLFFSFLANAQKEIAVSTDKFITLNFPSKIESSRISIPDLISMETKDDNLFLQYLTTEGVEKSGNLLIKTIDGYYYSFIIKYEDNPRNLNYFFDIYDSLRKTAPPKPGSDAININDQKEKIITKDNVVAVLKDQNVLSKVKDAVKTKGRSLETVVAPLTGIEKVAAEIVDTKGYLRHRNIVKTKNVEVINKGVYYDSNKLYFYFQFNNTSNIPYDIESYKFEVVNVDSEGASTQSQIVYPVSIYNKVYKIDAKSKNDVVFVFERFTIDENKTFNVTLQERNGDRVMNYSINSSTLLEAKVIK